MPPIQSPECDLSLFAKSPPNGSPDSDSVLSQTLGPEHEPINRLHTTGTKQLNVLHKRDGQGKLLYMAARTNHLSYGSDLSLWQVLFPQDLRLLEAELRCVLKPKCIKDIIHTDQDYLRVAMGHMLERIVYWDRDEATKFEAVNGAKALSTIPMLEDIDQQQMRHLVNKFRSAMRRLKNSDWRRSWGELSEEALQGLLRFTFLNARPVLAWELDFDDLEPTL